jgi:Tfp pilus assembly protein PilN
VNGRVNLASRRSRNERLPALLLALACLALLGASVEHAREIRRLLPGQSSALHQEVGRLEEELAGLRKEAAGLRGGPPPDKDRVEEWQLVKDLVDRRVFRWTRLFARLADTLPEDVRLQAVTPSLSHGNVELELTASAKSLEAGLRFIHVLETRPEFADVYPKGSVQHEAATGEEVFGYTMRYLDVPELAPASGAGR